MSSTEIEKVHVGNVIPKRTFESIPTDEVTLTHLKIKEGISFEEWERAGRTLGDLSRGSQFWIGDWILYGEANYGEMYAQAVEDTGLAKQTLLNYVWVARAIPPQMRRPELSWQHHLIAARITAKTEEQALAKREEWLDNAVAGKWSTRDFLEVAQQQKALPSPEKKGPTWGEEELCEKCGRLVKAKCE